VLQLGTRTIMLAGRTCAYAETVEATSKRQNGVIVGVTATRGQTACGSAITNALAATTGVGGLRLFFATTATVAPPL
jgi:hypothetical protein